MKRVGNPDTQLSIQKASKKRKTTKIKKTTRKKKETIWSLTSKILMNSKRDTLAH